MSFSKIKFFGATVKSVNSTMGWGTQNSSCTIQLVEDPADADFFLPPLTGTPAYFFLENFQFYGLLKRWQRQQDINGKPTFNITIEDPRDILDNAQVLIDTYSGPTFNVPNLLNVFGYWESFGFGGSSINEGGMPWNKIKEAIQVMVLGSIGQDYGGPLIHKGGITYTVDLSELPNLPNYYRISGTSLSLLELISKICDDAAMDFFVQLVPGTVPIIKIRTASRRLQKPLGTISSLISINTESGLCVGSANGIEATNVGSSAFLVGAPKTIMYEAESSAIYPFWGIGTDGLPILGSGFGYDHTFTLNALEVSDILGDTTYTCNVLELCCALVDMDMWQDYIYHNKPELADALLMVPASAIDELLGNDIKKVKDVKLTNRTIMEIAGQPSLVQALDHLASRLYSFVQKYASEYLGKKFIVEIPFVVSYTESETGRIVYNNEVTDSGYAPETNPPLSLNPILQTQFQTQDGKFTPYAVYENEEGLDFSRLFGGDFVIDTSAGIFTHCSVDPQILFINGVFPAVVVTLSSPLYEAPADLSGAGIDIIDTIFKDANDQPLGQIVLGELYKDGAADTLGWYISPLPVSPIGITIPFKSNTATYGPWYAVGAPGRVNFEADYSLAPWNYGGFNFMNLAANAKVLEAATFEQYAETGFLELAGAPLYSLGDIIQTGGPNITGIETGYSVQGVTTRYNFSTFTQRFGVLGKANNDRIKRISGSAANLRREIRRNANKILQPLQTSAQGQVAESFLYMKEGFFPKAARPRSPHSMLFGRTIAVADSEKRCDASSISTSELVRNLWIDDDERFQSSAAMSYSGLIRPFSSAAEATQSRTSKMSQYNLADNAFPDAINVQYYDPFQANNDIEWYTYGNTYEDLKAYHNDGPETGRFLGLRGPLVVSGWGTSIENECVPSGEDPNTFLDGYLRKCHLWKTGPVDLLWDNYRGVWTSHDLKFGNLKSTLTAGGSGLASINSDIETDSGYEMPVHNIFSSTIPSGTKVTYGWMSDISKWVVISADCE